MNLRAYDAEIKIGKRDGGCEASVAHLDRLRLDHGRDQVRLGCSEVSHNLFQFCAGCVQTKADRPGYGAGVECMAWRLHALAYPR